MCSQHVFDENKSDDYNNYKRFRWTNQTQINPQIICTKYTQHSRWRDWKPIIMQTIHIAMRTGQLIHAGIVAATLLLLLLILSCWIWAWTLTESLMSSSGFTLDHLLDLRVVTCDQIMAALRRDQTFEADFVVHSETTINALLTMMRRKYVFGLHSDRYRFSASLAGIFVQKKQGKWGNADQKRLGSTAHWNEQGFQLPGWVGWLCRCQKRRWLDQPRVRCTQHYSILDHHFVSKPKSYAPWPFSM